MNSKFRLVNMLMWPGKPEEHQQLTNPEENMHGLISYAHMLHHLLRFCRTVRTNRPIASNLCLRQIWIKQDYHHATNPALILVCLSEHHHECRKFDGKSTANLFTDHHWHGEKKELFRRKCAERKKARASSRARLNDRIADTCSLNYNRIKW